MSRVKKNKFYIQSNVDKTLHQKWGDANHPKSNLINIPRPYAMLLAATPNCGKTLTIKNLLVHMSPIPSNIFIAHCETWDPEAEGTEEKDFINTEVEEIPEYKGIKAVFFKSFPPIDWWDKFKDEHNLLIVDDVNIRQWAGKRKDRLNTLDKMWSWCRTHRNLTLICASQSIFQQIPPSVYRYANVFVIWKVRDKFVQTMIGRITGIDNDCWRRIFDLCKTPYDNITIDNTNFSPAQLRFNLAKKIEYHDVCEISSSDSDPEYETEDESD